MRISYSPYQSSENKYIDIMVNIIKTIDGAKVYPFKLKIFFYSQKKHGEQI
jgi:hypothetical protein